MNTYDFYFNNNQRFQSSFDLNFYIAKDCARSPYRGVYIDKGCNITSDNVELPNFFEVLLWIKIDKEGTIIAYDDITVQIINGVFNNTLINSANLNIYNYSWLILYIKKSTSLDDSRLILKFNKNGITDQSWIYNLTCHSNIGNFIIGEFNSSYPGFKGFIYRTIIQQYNSASFYTIELCSSIKTSNCLWDASVKEYYFNESNFNCKSFCSTCRRNTSCNTCINDACTQCYTSFDICDSCIEGIQPVNGICECPQGKRLYVDENGVAKCKELGECLPPAQANQKIIGNCCYSICPAGYTEKISSICEKTNDEIINISGDQITTDKYNDSYNNIISLQGTPYSFKQRGYYFDNNQEIEVNNELVFSFNLTFHI